MIIKMRLEQVAVGQWVVAYSAKSKKLSCNGKSGVVCQVVALDEGKAGVELDIPGQEKNMTLRNLDERGDAWLAELSEDMVFNIVHDGSAGWPTFTGKMKGAKGAVKGAVSRHEDVDFVMVGTYISRVSWLVPETVIGDVIVDWRKVEEAKRKEVEEARQAAEKRLAARRGDAVRLGKNQLDDGQLNKLKWGLELRDTILKQRGKQKQCDASSALVEVPNKADIGTLAADKCEIHTCFNGPCHSNMATRLVGLCGMVWTAHVTRTALDDVTKKEHELAWIDYIANYSGLAKCHLVKDADDIYENGYLLDTSFPSRLMFCATSAPRQQYEKPAKVKAFGMLMDGGVNPHFAWFAAQHASGSYEGMRLDVGYGSHTFMSQSELDDKGLLNFLRGTPEVEYNPYMNQQSYGGNYAQWCNSRGGNTFTKALVEQCKAKAKATNFGKPGYHSADELSARVEAIGIEWCKKMNINPVTLEDL